MSLSIPSADRQPLKPRVVGRLLELERVFTAHFGVGQVLWAVAFLLGARGAWSMREFPRWLTVLLALPGILALTQILLQLITGM